MDGVERQFDDLVALGRERVDDAADARIVRFREIRTAELTVRLTVSVRVDHTLATCFIHSLVHQLIEKKKFNKLLI